MLTLNKILDKLYRLPDEFEEKAKERKWCAACIAYETAVIVSRFIEMDKVPRDRLLNRFDQTAVEQAYKAAGWYEEEVDADRERNRKKAV